MSKPTNEYTTKPIQLPVSIGVLTALSLTLSMYGLLPLIFPEGPEDVKNAPFLTGFRNSSGRFFLAPRKEQAPVLYYGLHVAPALVWCALMPLQHIQRIRKTKIAFHINAGRAIMICNTILSTTGLLFPLLNLSWTHPDFFHVHVWRIGKQGYPIFAWPTFALSTTVLGLFISWTAYETWASARRKNIREHQRWATIYTAMGYTVPLQRVWMTVYIIVGNVLARLPSKTQDWFGVPVIEKEIWAGELDAFAWSNFMAILSTAVYLGVSL